MSLGPTGAVSSTSDFHSGGCEFAPWLGLILTYVEIGHEITSTADLSLSLIQEEQLSVTGKRMCTKYCLINHLGLSLLRKCEHFN